MANAHKHKQRVLRQIDDPLWADLGDGAHTMGSDRSAVSRQLFEWWVGRAGAELPERPPPRPEPTAPPPP